MTLNMKNYKGFEKKPYCNAHCPQAKATTVADTPEIRRLAENTRIQSQAKYHEDFEKSKGKGFTAIADDPETRRIKETSKIISNVAYHGELERKKQMEEKRGLSSSEELPMVRTGNITSNNNNMKHQNRMQQHNIVPQNANSNFSPVHQQGPTASTNQTQQYQQSQNQRQLQQMHHQQQQLLQKQQQQQQLLKQQQQQQQYGQNDPTMVNRQSGRFIDGQVQQSVPRHMQQPQYPVNHPQHQQQLLMRQQQQQQQQIMMQQRQAIDPSNMIMNRQTSKQAINHPQNMIKHPHMVPVQAQKQPPIKYVPMNDNNQSAPHHLVHGGGQPQMLNPQMSAALVNGQRLGPPNATSVGSHTQMIQGYSPQYPVCHMNGMVSKQQAHPNYIGVQQQPPPPHLVHQSQIQQTNHHQQVRGPVMGQQMPFQTSQQVPRRVFRAMYDYVANDVDEVSFFENDILIDCVDVDRNWLAGKVARTGQTGMLPANYVTELPSQ